MKRYIVTWKSVTNDGFDCFETTSLSDAKKCMKEHTDSKGLIYKFWRNGDFECLGYINLQGSNKTFVANTKQKKTGYN